METDETPLERIRRLFDELTATSIVAHTHPHYHGFQFDGEWLDRWKDAVLAECDRIDEEVRDGR